VVESYAHVHHIVSGVGGTLRGGVTPGDVVRAVFPGGTITGCPKVRTMALIDDLEDAPRGAYTGAMGYLNRDGSCDLNILIRSIEIHGDRFSFAAGSGIVADSDPVRELEETRAKARGMELAVAGT
jgi:anthranilate synthase component 1